MWNSIFKRTVLFYLQMFLFVGVSSCDRIKRKGDQVTNKAKEHISGVRKQVNDKKEEWKEKFNPTYDYEKPDTKHNRMRFLQYLEMEPSVDVRNIYAYGDFFGADYKVMIAFTCDQGTIDSIIAKKALQPAGRKGGGLQFLDEFPWWDKSIIDSLEGSRKGIDQEYWEYLWYDPKTKRAFFQEYGM